MLKRIALSAVALTMALTLAPVVTAQAPALTPGDAITEPAFKGPEVVAFIGVKPGDQIADIVAGRFVRLLSQTVGPKGKVYAYMPDEVLKLRPDVTKPLVQAAAAPGSNIVFSQHPISKPELPSKLDAVFIRQNYHDLHDEFMGPADVAAFNKAVFAALKPGGVYVVLDHAATPGSGLKDTNTLHRIDIAAVKSEVQAAGFKLEAESNILANPADDHTKMVLDKSIQGKTDQFLLKFRKPK